MRRNAIATNWTEIPTALLTQGSMTFIATDGSTGLGDLVLASVAERVVCLAPCPALTIRPPGASTMNLRAS